MIHSNERLPGAVPHPHPGEAKARPGRFLRDLAIAVVTFACAFSATSVAKSWHSRQNFPGGISVSGTTTLSGTTTISGAVTNSGAITDTAAYTHSGTGTRTHSSTGAITYSGGDITLSGADTDFAMTGATSDLTISGGGDFTLSGDGIFTHSGTGVGTISTTGAYTITSGDWTFNEVDVLLTGASADVQVSGGGDVVVSSSGNVNISGTGSFQIDGDSVVNCDTVVVTTGEVLALFGTPKVLVAAPGANKFISVTSVLLSLDYNSTAYDGVAGAEDLIITYTNGSGAKVTQDIETTGFLDQGNDETRYINGNPDALAGAGASDPLIPVSNAAIVLSLLTAEIATGNSPLDIRICYSIQPDLL